MRPGSLILLTEHLESLGEQAAAEAPIEACGLLAGRDGRVERVLPMRNAAHSPLRFRLDPAEQLDAFESLDREGLELVGIFHSHPAGAPLPSATDVQEAAYPVVNVIISQTGGKWAARGFWIEGGTVEEIPLVCEK